MKTKVSAPRLALLLVMLATTAGCAAATKASRDDVDYWRTDFRNKFIDDRASCLAAGGRILIQGWGGALDRDDIPRTRVRYSCI